MEALSIIFFVLALAYLILSIECFLSKKVNISNLGIAALIYAPPWVGLFIGIGKYFWNRSNLQAFNFSLDLISGWIWWIPLVIGSIIGIFLIVILNRLIFTDTFKDFHFFTLKKKIKGLLCSLCIVIVPLILDAIMAYKILGGRAGFFKFGVLIGSGYIILVFFFFITLIFEKIWEDNDEDY